MKGPGGWEASRPCLLPCLEASHPARTSEPLNFTVPRYASDAVGRLQHALRLRDAVALSVVDAQALQHVDDFLILGEFGDRLFAGEVTDFVDRAHHFPIDGIVQNLFDETAVDLQVIDREVLQVSERRQPGAEIIERELAA